jgi:hypothetical protein|tara:strand:- start:428 stop:823 length:396 start_codon:yes stop_codon:yes gene_type:complete
MDKSEIDTSNYEEHADEIEALECIFEPTELTIYAVKPYVVEVIINSNTESEEKNNLKLKVRFDLPGGYPHTEEPIVRIKSLSGDYLDNNDIYRYEQLIRKTATESLGMPMIFTLCDLLREEIAELNDAVLT